MERNTLPAILLASLCLSASGFIYGQVGVNTTAPKATLDVTAKTTDGSRAEGLLAPRLTGNQIKSGDASYGTAQDGTLLYATAAVGLSSPKTVNITAPGYYYYDAANAVWQSLGRGTSQAVVSDCNTNGFAGSYYNGVSLTSSNKFSVNLTNNSFTAATIAFQASDLELIGVSGMTVSSVSPSSVTLASGQSQLVEYTLSGTPASSGTLTGTWTKLALSCVKSVAVSAPAITSLNCGGATHNGTLTGGTSASGVSSVISYTGGNGSAYNTQTVSSTGVTGLTATLSGGTFANGNGTLTYTITGIPSGAGTASFPLNIGGQSCTLTRDVILPAVISSLDCSGATNNGTLIAGTSSSGVSSVISYTGGNSGTYSSQTINSTGVTGLTATLSAGTLASGSGSLTYTITGTPSGGGTASFAISIGGQSCTFTRTVDAPITIPATITLAQNKTYMIASIYDQDYLPYTAPTGAATTATQAANGVNESVTVNVQGSITTTGVTLSIPVTATGNGTLPAFSQTITIPANMTEDGISRDLTFSWTSQAYTSSTKFITATLKSVGGTLNAKKLDINAGIGNDALGVLLGQFTYPYNNAGNTTTYSIRDIPGIPDKMFGVADNTGSTTTHQMLYLPIIAEDGKTWLNNNLGADYANINKASFNPEQQATGATDYNAYGSLFQWGRKPDGHELINWTSGTTGTRVNGTTTTLSNNPANALFITSNSGNYDWRVTQDDSLWATAASANNPCPSGFRVPTVDEQDTLFVSAGISNSATAAGSVLKFTVSGTRNNANGSVNAVGINGFYWSSSVNGTYAIDRTFNSGGTGKGSDNRALGFSVRCLKD